MRPLPITQPDSNATANAAPAALICRCADGSIMQQSPRTGLAGGIAARNIAFAGTDVVIVLSQHATLRSVEFLARKLGILLRSSPSPVCRNVPTSLATARLPVHVAYQDARIRPGPLVARWAEVPGRSGIAIHPQPACAARGHARQHSQHGHCATDAQSEMIAGDEWPGGKQHPGHRTQSTGNPPGTNSNPFPVMHASLS